MVRFIDLLKKEGFVKPLPQNASIPSVIEHPLFLLGLGLVLAVIGSFAMLVLIVASIAMFIAFLKSGFLSRRSGSSKLTAYSVVFIVCVIVPLAVRAVVRYEKPDPSIGGNSFGFFQIVTNDTGAELNPPFPVYFCVEGDWPFYPIKAHIQKIYLDKSQSKESVRKQLESMDFVSLPPVVSKMCERIEAGKYSTITEGKYGIFVTAKNGSFVQSLNIAKCKGKWEVANIVQDAYRKNFFLRSIEYRRSKFTPECHEID